MADVQDWTCAMHPSVHSQKPGKCPICGMDLIPVTRRKEESSKTDQFVVPIQRQQQIGVTYAEVRSRQMRMELGAVGTLEVDQALIFELVTRLDGYIEELQVASPGEHVTRGEPLMTIYSPDLRAPQQELVSLLKVQANGGVGQASVDPLIFLARHRLQQLNVDPNDISELERTGQPTDLLVLRSPFEGVVSEAPMKIGMSVKRGDRLMTLLNLSRLWLWAAFYENEMGLLREGQSVRVTLPALPNRSFDGKIVVISPTMDPVKRTVMVRIDLPNPDGELRPGMFANVVVEIDAGKVLAVPFESVLPTGSQMLVFIDRGSGELEPRFIRVGRQFVDLSSPNHERYYQVAGGLREGERIVWSANFLIDAEAQIQGAVRNFGGK